MKVTALPEGRVMTDSDGHVLLQITQGANQGKVMDLDKEFVSLQGRRALISIKYEETDEDLASIGPEYTQFCHQQPAMCA